MSKDSRPEKDRAGLVRVGSRVRINNKAPVEYRGRTGIVTELGPNAEYRIEFEDGRLPTTGYLNQTCLDW